MNLVINLVKTLVKTWQKPGKKHVFAWPARQTWDLPIPGLQGCSIDLDVNNPKQLLTAGIANGVHGWVLGVGFWVECEGFVVESEDSI